MAIVAYDEIQPLAFTVDPDAFPDRRLHTLAFPPEWMRILREQWQPRYPGQHMPTRDLADLASALDQAIVSVVGYGLDLPDRYWIAAERPTPPGLLHHLVASWAATHLTYDRPHVDWYQLLDPAATEGRWEEREVPICGWTTRPNGTAAPVPGMYHILPTHLATELTRTGLDLLDGQQPKHSLILGPTGHGPREAVEWPPRPMPDRDGPAPWSLGVRLGTQIAWQNPTPRVHLDLILHRWLHLPLAWSPNLNLHVWLLAPDGLVRPSEEPTFLRARATWRGNWKWASALEHLATRLGQIPYPPMPGILQDPVRYLSGGKRMAAVQYQTGMTLSRNSQRMRELARTHGGRPAKTIHHPVKPGFLPIDHRQVLEATAKVLEPLGLTAVRPVHRRSTTTRTTSPRQEPEGRSYTLELWSQAQAWRDLLLAEVTDPEHGLGLTPQPPAADDRPTMLRFSGAFDLSVVLNEIGALAGGLPLKPREQAKDRGMPEARRRRINDISTTLHRLKDTSPGRNIGAIIEIEGPRAFDGKHFGDPKNTIRAGFAENQRITQFMLPTNGTVDNQEELPENELLTDDDIVEVVLTEDISDEETDTTPEPDTSTKELMRAGNTIRDALRQLGRIPQPHTPPSGEPTDVCGIWLEAIKGNIVPIAIRIQPSGWTTAHLPGLPEIPYPDLHIALAREQGRLAFDKASDSAYIDFLRRTLIPDDHQRPRLMLVGGRNVRTRGWPWLQSQHLRADVLILPGADPEQSIELDPHDARAADRTDHLGIRLPEDCPGLRIVRIIERDASREVPHVFGRDDERPQGITQGLFALHDRLYYGLAPKPVQGRGPIALTKFDPTTPRAAHRRGWNTNALEIIPAFLQPGDDPAEWAMYVQALRTAHLHTNVPTRLPLPLHLAHLAARYIQRSTERGR